MEGPERSQGNFLKTGDARPTSNHVKRNLPVLAVLAAATLCGWAALVQLVPIAGIFRWDEAAHAMQGLLIAHDLRTGDWLAFLYDSYRQVYWPPLHSWLAAAAFLVAGPSEASARAVSVLAYAILAPVLYVAGRHVVGTRPDALEHGQIWLRPAASGLIAAALALTSPTLLTHASQAMLESTGLLALAAAFLAFFRTTSPAARPIYYTLLGVTVLIAYFVKTNYGLLLLLALILFLSAEWMVRPGRVTRRQLAYAVVPMGVVWVVWFMYPPKILSTWQALVNQPWNADQASGLEWWLFYPRAMLDMSGSPGILALFIAAWLTAVRRGGRNVRFLVFFVGLQLLVAQVHQTKHLRHILPVFPALFLLSGFAVTEWWTRLRGKVPARLLLAGVLSAAWVAMLVSLPSRDWRSTTAQSDPALLARIAANSAGGDRTLVVSAVEVRFAAPPVLDWYLAVHAGLLAPPGAGEALKPVVQRRIARTAERTLPASLWLRVRPLVTRAEHAGQVRTFYMDLSGDERQEVIEELRISLEKMRSGRIVSVTSTLANARWPAHSIAEVIARAGGWVLVADERLDAQAVRVGVWQRARAIVR
ncbi:MAG: hypothetical protein M3466_09650 [Gemmatimonadota bacterium]|nr:hypothetical protein [Gemmatimonadota bacterium]